MADQSYVLVVDDEAHVTCVMKSKLERNGIDCERASNGIEGLDIALRVAPAIVVTDYQMPGMNGLEFAARLHESPTTADVPVILLTARGHKIKPTELAESNIQIVLDKPFSPRQLLATIKDFLGNGQSGHEQRSARAA